MKLALAHTKNKAFPTGLQDELMTTLAQFDCRSLPTPSNMMSVIEQSAQYQFITKPAAGIAMINSGSNTPQPPTILECKESQ